MLDSLATETPADEVRRLQAKGWTPSRVLSAIGHPGYGAAFARRVIGAVLTHETVGLTVHEAIYGGLSAARKMEVGR